MRETLEGSAEEGGRASAGWAGGRVAWDGTGPAMSWHWAGRCMAPGRLLYGTGPAAVAGWGWRTGGVGSAAADSDTLTRSNRRGPTCMNSAERSRRRASRSCTTSHLSHRRPRADSTDSTLHRSFLPTARRSKASQTFCKPCEFHLRRVRSALPTHTTHASDVSGRSSRLPHRSVAPTGVTAVPSFLPHRAGLAVRPTALQRAQTHKQTNAHLVLQDARLQPVRARRVAIVVPTTQARPYPNGRGRCAPCSRAHHRSP
jgi:hypothetical protein